jgi:hypothetical protein
MRFEEDLCRSGILYRGNGRGREPWSILTWEVKPTGCELLGTCIANRWDYVWFLERRALHSTRGLGR